MDNTCGVSCLTPQLMEMIVSWMDFNCLKKLVCVSRPKDKSIVQVAKRRLTHMVRENGGVCNFFIFNEHEIEIVIKKTLNRLVVPSKMEGKPFCQHQYLLSNALQDPVDEQQLYEWKMRSKIGKLKMFVQKHHKGCYSGAKCGQCIRNLLDDRRHVFEHTPIVMPREHMANIPASMRYTTCDVCKRDHSIEKCSLVGLNLLFSDWLFQLPSFRNASNIFGAYQLQRIATLPLPSEREVEQYVTQELQVLFHPVFIQSFMSRIKSGFKLTSLLYQLQYKAKAEYDYVILCDKCAMYKNDNGSCIADLMMCRSPEVVFLGLRTVANALVKVFSPELVNHNPIEYILQTRSNHKQVDLLIDMMMTTVHNKRKTITN